MRNISVIKKSIGEITWSGNQSQYVHLCKTGTNEYKDIYLPLEMLQEFVAEVKRAKKLEQFLNCSCKEIE